MNRNNIFSWILALMMLCTGTFTHAQSASGNALFILDGSGSMWGQVEGQHKIVIAKDVMTRLVQELPDTIRAGLQVYGHRSKGDCDDIEMLVPVGADNRQALLEQIESINPKGKTPITKAFQHAAEQLQALEDNTTIVLVSDGKETCVGDPCTLVRELREQGIKVRVHVVGFDVAQDEREQLVCIAEAGGGKYFSADNADQLQQALTEVREEVVAMVDESRCRQYAETAAGQLQSNLDNACGLQGELWTGDANTHFEHCRALPDAEFGQLEQTNAARQQGLDACLQERQTQQQQCQQYAATAVQHEQQNLANECGFEGESWQADSQPHLDWCVSQAADPKALAAAHEARTDALAQCLAQQNEPKITGIKLQAVLLEGGEPLANHLHYVVYEGQADARGKRKQIDASGADMPFFELAPGQYHVTVQHGAATAAMDIELAAGELAERTLNLNAGYLRLASAPAEGAEPLTSGLYYHVYSAKTDLQGKRKQIDTSGAQQPLFQLPAGDYRVTVTYGKALATADVQIKAGELTEQTLNLNVGHLRLNSVLSEGSEAISKNLLYEVYAAKTDLDGNRKHIDYSGSAQPLFKLTQGPYHVTVKHGEAVASADVEVRANELTEHSLVLNAGYLRLNATQGDTVLKERMHYQVYAAKTDLEGHRKRITGIGSQEALFKLPAGDYYVTVTHQDQTSSAEVIIKPGELTEQTLVLEEQ